MGRFDSQFMYPLYSCKVSKLYGGFNRRVDAKGPSMNNWVSKEESLFNSAFFFLSLWSIVPRMCLSISVSVLLSLLFRVLSSRSICVDLQRDLKKNLSLVELILSTSSEDLIHQYFFYFHYLMDCPTFVWVCSKRPDKVPFQTL